ncbi:MAG: hypothetical protein ACXIU2_21040 [Cyclobacteriaceae bacterium]
MKKIICFISLITMISISSFAQVKKGDQLLGVQSVFVKSFPKDSYTYDTRIYNIDFSVFHIFMVNDGLGLGYFNNINISGSNATSKDSGVRSQVHSNINIMGHLGPMVRYAIPISPTSYVFPQFLTGLGRNWSNYRGSGYYNGTRKSVNGSSITELQFGMANFVNQKVAFETKVGYGWAKTKENGEKNSLKALGASFGAVLYFERKSKI